jgi:ABC-2 type transport system ATP-binding protein
MPALEVPEKGSPGVGPAALEVRDLVYQHAAGRGVDGLSLSVRPGSVCGLIGPNGCGKSTLLNLVAGLLEPQSGGVSVLGGPPRSAAGRLGWVFQEQSLDPMLTSSETLQLSARLYGAPLTDCAQALAVVGLNDRAADRVGTLSGGMRRRLELARAIQHSPELLIMDEPTLGLDLDSRREIWGYLAELNARGLTIVVATNDVSEAERVCDDVAFLRDGRLMAQGTPQALKEGLAEESVHIRWPGLSDSEFTELQRTDGVTDASREEGIVRLSTRDSGALLAGAARLRSGRIEAITIRESSLEDAYFRLTGTPLAGGEASG